MIARGGDRVRRGDVMVSLPQVCQRYHKTEAQVRYAIKQGRLKATQVGWQWCFNLSELPEIWPETPRTLKRLKRGKTIE